jgi:hypothetical protein
MSLLRQQLEELRQKQLALRDRFQTEMRRARRRYLYRLEKFYVQERELIRQIDIHEHQKKDQQK